MLSDQLALLFVKQGKMIGKMVWVWNTDKTAVEEKEM